MRGTEIAFKFAQPPFVPITAPRTAEELITAKPIPVEFIAQAASMRGKAIYSIAGVVVLFNMFALYRALEIYFG
jgi:hypothetical protein